MYKSNASGKHEHERRGKREHTLQEKQHKSLGECNQISPSQTQLVESYVASPSHLSIK